ncbi:MAG TPA: hypothetical protein ENG33_00735, partial [Chloroflexi bacterium]|nr:hypothetical protein [Chloroflexota bacterium]
MEENSMPITSFYPSHLREIFTDRERELAYLEQVADELIQGRPRYVALFGLRRIGKTLLIKEQMARLLEKGDVLPVYIDFEEICTAPELFAQRYVGWTSFWALTKGQDEPDAYLTASSLLKVAAASSPVTAQVAASLQDELSRSRTDASLMLKLAFDFPERLAKELDTPLILFLDEFQEITVLSHYPGIGDPLALFRAAIQRQERVAYVIAGSAITVMEKMVQEHRSPLFLQFELLELSSFTREATVALARKWLPGISTTAARQIHRLSGGHPFYITALARRLGRMPWDGEITPEVVSYAFILEALSPEGQIYHYCRYLYDVSLQRARGYGVLKAILQVLAEEEGLSLSEVARRIAKSPSATRGYLRWLMEVDLVVEEGKLYFYRDPVLRYWVAHMSKGVELYPPWPRREGLRHLVEELETKYRRLSSELGLAKESEVRELLRRFNGQVVDGALLGVEGSIKLPYFRQVAPYRSPDGKVEIDALAENGERWAVEIKW